MSDLLASAANGGIAPERSYRAHGDVLLLPGQPRHVVQFYEDDSFLCDTVTRFIRAGLAIGEPAVIIATKQHCDALSAALTANSFDVERMITSGQLVILDAHRTLEGLLIDGMPDWQRFEMIIGSVVAKSSRSRGGASVRAYGEMVDLLWRDGRPKAALRLEEMWNDLGRSHSFFLLCAYGMAGFSKEAHGAAFRDICGAHSHVLPTEQFSRTLNADEQQREISLLQQRASALESEVKLRTELERTLRAAVIELRASQEELRDFFENAVEPLHWVGPTGLLLWANAAELDLLGYSQSEYVGHHVDEFHADQEVANDILAQLARGEELHEYEARLKCKDGTIKYVLINSNVFQRDGKFVHTRCFTRDITERKRAEDERQRLLAREQAARADAVAANKAKDEFLATLSHELRTPLNAIFGWTQVLRMSSTKGSELDDGLETIERNARNQARMIEDLIDVSRIASGKIRLELSRVDLSQTVAAALEAVRPSAEAKRILLETTGTHGSRWVNGDAMRLQQIVSNLLTNAVKFTPERGRVSVALEVVQSTVRITVTDTGKGISAEFLPCIFERFTQADISTSRTGGGLGLGLAIVKQLVELHGGVIRAHSAGEGQGSVFSVDLPSSDGVAEGRVQPSA